MKIFLYPYFLYKVRWIKPKKEFHATVPLISFFANAPNFFDGTFAEASSTDIFFCVCCFSVLLKT